jgi:hypothetical protein
MLSPLLRGRVVAAFLLSLGLAPAALAQTVPFQLAVQSSGSTFLVQNGSTLTLSVSGVGQNASIKITLTYEGQTSAAVAQPQLFGQSSFTLSNTAASTTLQPGQSLSFNVTYTAANATQATGQLTIGYTEAGATSTSASAVGQIGFTLTGTAPNLIVTYTLPTTGNVTPIATGNTITVPATVVGSSITVTMDVVNQGSGSGSIQSISIVGSDPSFTLVSLPLLPLQSIAAGSYAQFGVVYSPTQTGTDTDMLQIVFPNQTLTFGLQGTAIASQLTYQLVQGTQTSPLTPGQTITFPNTNVGAMSSATVLAQNTSPSTITSLNAAASGTGYSITDEPIPGTSLNVNQTASFTITFAPTTPGTITGRFRVGNDSFNLTGMAIGTQFSYSFSSGSASNTVVPGGTVSFTPQTVGQSVNSTFTIQNTGTAAATITSIGVNPQTTPATFAISTPPQLPLSLGPGQSTQFTVTFSPQTTGLSTAGLVVDDQQFVLSGFGNAPQALPSYQFTGASGAQTPLSQVAVGLTLSSAYSLPISGKLVISVNSGNLPSDPSVQFLTGGTTVDFTIPQGSTQAVFSTGSQISLQTGTVEGTITLTPSFAIPSGLDITPASPATVSLTVPAAAVVLLDALVTQESSTSITLEVTGYTTTRTLTAMQFQFTAAASANLTNGTVPVNIQPVAEAWFDSTQSDSFGGQFSISVPFNFTTTASLPSGATLISLLQSVSITAANEVGTSAAVSVSFTQ